MSKREKLYPSRRYARLTVGDAVRVAREMLDLSQAELAKISGISQPTLSGIEKNRVTLGLERAKRLARVLHVHPAVLLFPDWKVENYQKAS